MILGPGGGWHTGLTSIQGTEVVMIDEMQDLPVGVTGIRVSGRPG